MEEKMMTADNWDDIDLSDVIGEPETPADQPEEPAAPAGGESGETTQIPSQAENGKEPEAAFELKHLGKTHRVGRDEIIALAQKGMDYDRIRAKLEQPSVFEGFVQELAKRRNLSVDEFMDRTRAAILVRNERMEPDAAMERVKLERQEKAAQDEQRRAGEEKERRKADFKDFIRRYGDVDAGSIPAEVWEEVAGGETLVNSYMRYENAQLKARLETERKNFENRLKSTGSQSSSGTEKMDDWDRLWYET